MKSHEDESGLNVFIKKILSDETVVVILMLLQLAGVTVLGALAGFPKTGAIISVITFLLMFIVPTYRRTESETYRRRFPGAVVFGCVFGIGSYLLSRIHPDESGFYIALFVGLLAFCAVYFDLIVPDSD